MSIIFRNAGTIDPMSISTFGVSSKQDASAIGFFGTGLKYAIAILLRNKCQITIYTGGETLVFGTEERRVRNDDFTFVTMNGERLGFTTELGKTWDIHGAFRELYCNCMDEKGTVSESELGSFDHVRFLADSEHTAIVVTGKAFDEAWEKRAETILDTKPMEVGPAVSIHPGRSEHLYYRGIRAMRLAKPSLFTYNVTARLDLTEDRTIKYDFYANSFIRTALIKSELRSIVDMAVRAPDGSFEHDLSFEGAEPSKTFSDRVSHYMRTCDRQLIKSAAKLVQFWALGPAEARPPMQLNKLDTRRLEMSIEFCKLIGFPVDEYSITVLDTLGEGVLGQAHDGRILIAHRVFLMGTKMLAGTLIEEFLHLKHGVSDETRSMQNLLIDHICQLGEMVTGKPL